MQGMDRDASSVRLGYKERCLAAFADYPDYVLGIVHATEPSMILEHNLCSRNADDWKVGPSFMAARDPITSLMFRLANDF
jgi:hypothetical protein